MFSLSRISLVPRAALAAYVGLGAFALAPAVHAQGGPPPPMSPAQQKAMAKWQVWGESHLYVTALRNTVRGLSRLDTEPATTLNKAQARQLLAIYNSWHSKPTMSDDQAKKVNLQILATLSDGQREAMTARRGGRGGGPGGGGPGGGGPGGAPGGGTLAGGRGGGRPGGGQGGQRGGGGGGGFGGGRGGGGGGMMAGEPKEYNPLNPDSLPMPADMKTRLVQGMNDLIKDLQTRAR